MTKHVHLKVWGDWACFTRPEMKVERVSYPVITPSAARGILEAVFWEPQIYYTLSAITILKKGMWASVRRNEIQDTISLRTAKQWQQGKKQITPVAAGGGAKDGTQRNMLALRNVAYVISAELATTDLAQRPGDTVKKYGHEFTRRAKTGKCYHRSGLGMREFAADFCWVEDPQKELPKGPLLQEDLGLMLYDVFSPKERHRGFMWNKDQNNPPQYTGHRISPRPCYFQAQIKDSVLPCHPQNVDIIYPLSA